MKCPACGNELREKGAGGMTLDICYGGCGGIWFDNAELERMDPRASISLHTVWRDPNTKVLWTQPRPCPRCANQVLERKSFSESMFVEVDQCPNCGGIWLDEGEFSRIYMGTGGKAAVPLWAVAMGSAADLIRPGPSPRTK